MAKSKDHEILRIICGNQLAIMQALKQINNNTELDMRIFNVKQYWKGEFKESVGPLTDLDKQWIERKEI